jgi:5-(carboxyamino)imidazole ribonucleotide mutase
MKNDVAIIMGSKSDLSVMQTAREFLEEHNIPCEMTVVSAHRTPERMVDYAKTAKNRGVKVIIAGAGGAAHLPGMVASLTPLPVIGVPIKSSNSLEGIDSLLSIVQMPSGIPVATVAVNAAQNAAILALRILAIENKEYESILDAFQKTLPQKVEQQIDSEEFSSSYDENRSDETIED